MADERFKWQTEEQTDSEPTVIPRLRIILTSDGGAVITAGTMDLLKLTAAGRVYRFHGINPDMRLPLNDNGQMSLTNELDD